jgi:hypothetical protein
MAPSDRSAPLLLALCAAVAVAPGLLPGGALYMDNAPHLAEIHVLATEILPQDRWFTGWSDRVLAGSAVGQVNAPLAWTLLAGLVALGLPAWPLYALATALSNVAFTLGAWRLARRLVSPTAALLAAGLAGTLVGDLWGVAGAAGGMWPFRLANGVLLLGIAQTGRGRGAAAWAAWTALLVLTHTYTALIGLAWVLVEAGTALRAGRRAGAGRALGGAAVGLLVAAPFWLPIALEPGLRGFSTTSELGPAPLLLSLLAPLDLGTLELFGETRLLSGIAGGGDALALLAGLLLAWRGRDGITDRTALARVLAPLGALLLLVLGVEALGAGLLGPNAWRFLAFPRIGLCLLAGVGLAVALKVPLAARATVVVLAAAAAAAGVTQVPPGLDAAPDLRAAWAALPEAPGRVYHDDTAFSVEARGAFTLGHPGALLHRETGHPMVGSWYGLTPARAHAWTRSEAHLQVGLDQDGALSRPDLLARHLRRFGVGAVVSASPGLTAALAGAGAARVLAEHGAFTTLALTASPAPVLHAADVPAAISDLQATRGRVQARVGAEGPVTLRLAQGWHPWWTATLDGAPVPLTEEPRTGLVLLSLPHGGALDIAWRDPMRWTRRLGLVGLLLLAGLAAVGGRGGSDRRHAG